MRSASWPIPMAPYLFFANIAASSRPICWNCTSMRWTPPWTHYTKLNGSVCSLKIPTDSVDATNHFFAHSTHIRYISQQDDHFENAYVRQWLSSRLTIATMMTRHRWRSVSLHCQTGKKEECICSESNLGALFCFDAMQSITDTNKDNFLQNMHRMPSLFDK